MKNALIDRYTDNVQLAQFVDSQFSQYGVEFLKLIKSTTGK